MYAVYREYGAKTSWAPPSRGNESKRFCANNDTSQPLQVNPAQSFTSLRAGLTWSGWDVSLFAQNLFDSLPRLGGAQEVFAPYSLYTAYTYRPRTMGLTATYRY